MLADQLTQQHADAPARYRDLIAPDHEPQAGDLDELRSLMALLGKTPAQVKADTQAMLTVARLEQELEGQSAAYKAVDAAREKLVTFDAETKRLIAKREEQRLPLADAVNQASFATDRYTEIPQEIRQVKAQHRDVFGLPPKATVREGAGFSQVIRVPADPPNSHPIMPGEYEIRTVG